MIRTMVGVGLVAAIACCPLGHAARLINYNCTAYGRGSVSSGFVEGQNYVVFHYVTPVNGQIVITVSKGNGDRGTINAIQLATPDRSRLINYNAAGYSATSGAGPVSSGKCGLLGTAGDYWNNAYHLSTISLSDSAGNATGLTATPTLESGGNNGGNALTNPFTILNAYFQTSSSATITISGFSGAWASSLYDVYIYDTYQASPISSVYCVNGSPNQACSNAPQNLASGCGLLGTGGDYWNNVGYEQTGSAVTLRDSTGQYVGLTSVSTFSSGYYIDDYYTLGNPFSILDAFYQTSSRSTITISGFSRAAATASYDLYIYDSYPFTAGHNSIYSVNGSASKTCSSGSPINVTSFVQGQNYVVFHNVTPVNGKIIIAVYKGSDTNATISGFQLSTQANIPPDALAPVFTPGSGERFISGPTPITMASSTPGAAIYYTLDNATPTINSMRYTAPVTVDVGTVLKAIAVADGYYDSPVTTVGYEISTGSPIGWYDDAWGDNASCIDNASMIAAEGAEVVLPYLSGVTNSVYQGHLDACNGEGMKLILELGRSDIAAQNVGQIASVVQTFGSNPGLYGWYTADEPWNSNIPLSDLQVAYNTIRQYSDKPVFIGMCLSDLIWQTATSYASAYDVMMVDYYPFESNSAEFSLLENWESVISETTAAAQQVAKPWWSIIQAYGTTEPGFPVAFTKRLPTYTEERFMTYWSIVQGATGILFWSHDTCLASVAQAGAPYPYAGTQWTTDVAKPIMAEFKNYAVAIQNGAVAGAVTVTNAEVKAAVYKNNLNGEYYLITANSTTGTKTAQFTLTLPSGIHVSRVIPMSESRLPFAVTGDVFSDSFTAYQVHIYRLIPTSTSTPFLVNYNGAGYSPSAGNGPVSWGPCGLLGESGDYWNNAYRLSTVNLFDSTGNVTGLTATTTLNGWNNDWYALSSPYTIFNAFLFTDASSGTITISGVSGAGGYDLYIYDAYQWLPVHHSIYSINGGPSQVCSNGDPINVTSFVEGQNYVVFHNITSVNGQIVITISKSDDSNCGTLAAFQLLQTHSGCPGDANRDGRVTFEDFSILQNHYGQSVTGDTWGQGDFNNDGQVTFGDFSILQNHYGQSDGSAGPAPAATDALATLPCSAAALVLLTMIGCGLVWVKD